MSKEIIYSFKEYQEKYTSSLDKYFLEYEEIEEIDFIINEIEKYIICLQIINFSIDVAFSRFFRIEYGINLKTFCVPQETFDFIFTNENADYYYKMYNDIIGSAIQNSSTKEDCERKIKQTRLIFPKIISFLETKKTEFEVLQQIEKVKTKKPKKTLLEFIHNIEDKEGFILGLKNTFPTEQGKSIKAIVLKLVDAEILIYGTKDFLQLYNELKIYFKRDIGTYQSINDVKTVDTETTSIILKKLNPLITKHKTI